MVRTPSYDKNGMKKGAWSAEEDQLLRAYITRYGHSNWRELPNFAGLKRCGKSCRLRWMNYLRPYLKHGNYTKQEEDLIIQLHQKHGNKWAILASKLPGRTDNEIKNHWHTHLKKRVVKSITTFTSKTKPLVSEQIEKRSTLCYNNDIPILESCPLLSQQVTPTSTSTSTPMSREFSTSILSSFDDDGGLEEIINSSELFAELSSYSSLDLDINQTMTNDHLDLTSTKLDDLYGGDIQFHDEDFWRNLDSEIYQVILSPCANYYDDDLFDFFCGHSETDRPLFGGSS